MNLAERGVWFAAARPDGVALRTGGADTTWAQLGEQVARVAGGLAQRGIGPGDRVGILGANSVEWCALTLATLHLGGAVVPLNQRLAPPELAEILDHAGCAAIGYDAAHAEVAAGAQPDASARLQVSLDGEAAGDVTMAGLAEAPPLELVQREDSDVAVIAYTSGTTGLPKGVLLTHANLAACALITALGEGSTSERRNLLCIPLAFTGGIVNNFLATYAVGGTIVLEPAFVPDRVVEVLEAERITMWFAVPIMWEALLATERFAGADLSSLSTAVCGGARVPRAMLEAYHAKGVVVRQAYALTEASGTAFQSTHAEALEHPEAAGRTNLHTRARLLGEDRADVAHGEVGEIALQGPQVMAGYWRDEAATAAAFDDGWLLTGDLGRFDEGGRLVVVDRKKSMFISGGLNVYPAEVERVLDALPGVAECAVFGLPHERFGEACAAIVRGVEGPVDEAALLAHCREQLADYKVPRTIVQTSDALPRGMSGKLQRGEIVAFAEARREASPVPK